MRTISPRWRSPRSTGSLAPARQSTDPRSKIEAWLAPRGEHHDRADWAVVRAQDGTFLGEAVLNEVDLDNDSANYRVWLAGPHVFGQGYGTEITRLVVDYALGTCGLHRVSLALASTTSILAPSGSTRSAGSNLRDACGMLSAGRTSGTTNCSWPS